MQWLLQKLICHTWTGDIQVTYRWGRCYLSRSQWIINFVLRTTTDAGNERKPWCSLSPCWDTSWVKKYRYVNGLWSLFHQILTNYQIPSQVHYTLQEVCNKSIIKDPTTPQICRCTTVWKNNVRQSVKLRRRVMAFFDSQYIQRYHSGIYDASLSVILTSIKSVSSVTGVCLVWQLVTPGDYLLLFVFLLSY